MDMGGMTSGTDSSTDSSSMTMTMMTAFTTELGMGNLWFSGWAPSTAGTTFGACVGLFFLAIISRVLSVVHAGATQAWSNAIVLEREAALIGRGDVSARRSESGSSLVMGAMGSKPEDDATLGANCCPTDPKLVALERVVDRRHLALSPPFKLAHDLPRGFLFMVMSFVNYLLMLAVMSYEAWFFIAILLGLGAGEMAFGRFGHYHLDGHM